MLDLCNTTSSAVNIKPGNKARKSGREEKKQKTKSKHTGESGGIAVFYDIADCCPGW